MSIRSIKRAVPLLVLGLAAALLVALSSANRTLRDDYAELFRRSVESHPGLVVPVIDLPALDGRRLSIGAPAGGEKQILFFFTTTCQYCLASLPAVQRIAEAVPEDPVAVLYGFALDSMPAVRRYVEEQRLGYPVAVASDRRTAALYRVRRVPQITVIGADGRVSYTRQGVLEDRAAIDSVLAALDAPFRATGSTADPPRTTLPTGRR